MRQKNQTFPLIFKTTVSQQNAHQLQPSPQPLGPGTMSPAPVPANQYIPNFMIGPPNPQPTANSQANANTQPALMHFQPMPGYQPERTVSPASAFGQPSPSIQSTITNFVTVKEEILPNSLRN